MLVFNAGRYFYFSDHLSTGHWTDMFLVQPCLVVLPLLPLVLPLTWLLINVYGVALILALFYTARHFKVNHLGSSWFIFSRLQVVILIFQVSNDPFEDAEVTAPTHSSFWVKCREMWPYFLDTLIGRGKSPFRTENLFQTLSSVTVILNSFFALLNLIHLYIFYQIRLFVVWTKKGSYRGLTLRQKKSFSFVTDLGDINKLGLPKKTSH